MQSLHNNAGTTPVNARCNFSFLSFISRTIPHRSPAISRSHPHYDCLNPIIYGSCFTRTHIPMTSYGNYISAFPSILLLMVLTMLNPFILCGNETSMIESPLAKSQLLRRKTCVGHSLVARATTCSHKREASDFLFSPCYYQESVSVSTAHIAFMFYA